MTVCLIIEVRIQWLCLMLANSNNNNLPSQHHTWELFKSANSEAIYYTLRVLLLLQQLQGRYTLLCLELAPRLLCSKVRVGYFSYVLHLQPLFSLARREGKKSATTFSWEFHHKFSASLRPHLSLWKRVVIMPGYPEEEVEGETGSLLPEIKKRKQRNWHACR